MEQKDPNLELIFNAKKKAERHNATRPEVEVRHFVNPLNDYRVPWRGSDAQIARSQQVPLTPQSAPRVALWVPRDFLEHSFPHPAAFIRAALQLKDEVVHATWARNGPRPDDPTMYTGALGTAMLCLKAYLVTGSAPDLTLAAEIVDSCCAAAPLHPDNVTFLRGHAGIYAMGAATAQLRNDPIRRDFFLQHFSRIAERRVLSMGPTDEGAGLACELLNGRVGFLYAALFINRFVGAETVPWSTTGPIVDAVVAAGRAHATAASPLMYPWRSRRFWGASHGLAGVIQILLFFPLTEADQRDIKGALRYMLANRYFRGNFRVSAEDGRGDRLVSWCHGAPGVTMALASAARAFPGDLDLRAGAEVAANVVWERGLLRRVGLCHGISGNAYVFLALYRALGQQARDLFRARQFAGFVARRGKHLLATGEMHGGDHRHSLFEGLGGAACMWLDVARPRTSFFPGFEIMEPS